MPERLLGSSSRPNFELGLSSRDMPRGLEVSERDFRQSFRPPTPDRLDLLISYCSRELHEVPRPHHGACGTRGCVWAAARASTEFPVDELEREFRHVSIFEIDPIAVLRRRHELIGDSRRYNTSPYTVIECETDHWCCCAGDLRSLIHIHLVGKSTRWRSAPCSPLRRFRRP